jgi:cell fate regulator YaaT (PSP1 superfamily)
MAGQYLVRVGQMGRLGRFLSIEGPRYPRRSRVLVRTERGLEVGQVLAPLSPVSAGPSDGALLRRLTVEDELLVARLERRRHEALHACTQRLAELGCPTPLLDVELLFDGSALCFYFLGEPPAEVEKQLAELAKTYDAAAQIQRFAQTLLAGCGPGCGKEAAAGCGQGGCSSCAVAAACGGARHAARSGS